MRAVSFFFISFFPLNIVCNPAEYWHSLQTEEQRRNEAYGLVPYLIDFLEALKKEAPLQYITYGASQLVDDLLPFISSTDDNRARQIVVDAVKRYKRIDIECVKNAVIFLYRNYPFQVYLFWVIFGCLLTLIAHFFS